MRVVAAVPTRGEGEVSFEGKVEIWNGSGESAGVLVLKWVMDVG